MVDAGGQELNLAEISTQYVAQHRVRVTDTVTQHRQSQPRSCHVHCPRGHRHRIGVRETPGIGTEFCHILRDLYQHRYGSQASEDPADADRVADALPKAVSMRDLGIAQTRLVATGFQLADDKIRAVERAAATASDLNPCSSTGLAIEPPGDCLRSAEALRVDVIENDVQLTTELRHGEQVRQDP